MHTPLRVGAYVGEMGVDLWAAGRWRREWAEHDVMVMTPQILLNLLQHAIVKARPGRAGPGSASALHQPA